MKISAESIAKIRAVKKAIIAQPEFYDQSQFFDKENICNSACCIAGWAV